MLFRQKKMDVLIDVNAMTFDCDDFELKKCLALTTEDLRFFGTVYFYYSPVRFSFNGSF